MTFYFIASMNAMAQQTSLTIDNQTPGWLSSKINYSDQLSVERLKVTGYINGTDYKFLSQLIDNNLKSLNLEDVNIVEGGEPIHTLRMSTGELYYYYIRADLFPQWEEEYNFKNLRWLATPKSAELNLYSLDNDTLIANSVTETIGSESSPFKIYDEKADGYYLRDKCLVIGDGIKNVYFNHIYTKSSGVYNHTGLSNCTIVLPASIEYIDGLRMGGGTLISFNNNPESISYNACPQCLANVSNNKNFCNKYCKIKPFELWVPEGTLQSYLDSEIFNNATNIYEMAPPEKVELDYSRLKLYKDDTALLQVSLTPQNAYFNELTWETSDANIASVTQSGEVTAMNPGTAIVTVSSVKNPEAKALCQVTVYEHTTGIEITSTEKKISLGETTCINARTLPLDNSDNEITWSSDDENIATVDEKGNVTGIGQGSCTITATTVDGGYTATCEITVTLPVAVTGITLNQNTLQFDGIGETYKLEAAVLPEDAANKNVIWTSSDTSVCVVSNGMIVTVGMGTCVIIATTEDGGFMAVCVVSVTSATDIESIEQNGEKMFKIYDVNGTTRTHLQKGINIIRMSDSTTRKVLMK